MCKKILIYGIGTFFLKDYYVHNDTCLHTGSSPSDYGYDDVLLNSNIVYFEKS